VLREIFRRARHAVRREIGRARADDPAVRRELRAASEESCSRRADGDIEASSITLTLRSERLSASCTLGWRPRTAHERRDVLMAERGRQRDLERTRGSTRPAVTWARPPRSRPAPGCTRRNTGCFHGEVRLRVVRLTSRTPRRDSSAARRRLTRARKSSSRAAAERLRQHDLGKHGISCRLGHL